MVQMSLTLTLIPVSHRVLAAGGAASRVQGLGDRGRAHQVLMHYTTLLLLLLLPLTLPLY